MTMNMPLLRIAMMRPATVTLSLVFSPAGRTAYASLISLAAWVLANCVR
jgi:hypothetical protein